MSTSERLKAKLETYSMEQLKTLIRTMANCPKRDIAQLILIERRKAVNANQPKPIANNLNVYTLCNYDVRKTSPSNMEAINTYLKGCTAADLKGIRRKAKSKTIRDMAAEIGASRMPSRKKNKPRGVNYNTILNEHSPRQSAREKVPNRVSKCEPIRFVPRYSPKQGAKYRQELDSRTEPAPLTDLERVYQIPDDGNRPKWS